MVPLNPIAVETFHNLVSLSIVSQAYPHFLGAFVVIQQIVKNEVADIALPFYQQLNILILSTRRKSMNR